MQRTLTTPSVVAFTSAPPVHRGALLSLALATLLAALGTSIVSVGLPVLADFFHATFAQAQWIVIAYLLASTIVIVVAGRIGDLIGRRRLLVAGLVLFTLASALAGLAPGYGVLITARALQGIGAAMMMAMSLALVGSVVTGAKNGRAMGLLGTMSAVGTALGPSVGGFLIAAVGWQGLFLVCVPLGLVTALIAYQSLPADRVATTPQRSGFDHLGMGLLAVTLAAYTLSTTMETHTTYLVAVALIGLGLFVIRERTAPSALLPLHLFRNWALGTSLITNVCVTATVMATLVIGPFYLVDGLGLQATHVGLIMTIGPLVAAIMGVPAGRLVDRHGTWRISIVGLAVMVLGCGSLALVSTSLGIPGYLIPLAITTAGFAIFQVANNTAVMAQALPEQRGVTAGMLTLSRNLGLITGAAVMGALFALGATSSGATAKSAAAEAGINLTFAVTTMLVVAAWAFMELARRITKSHVSGQEDPQ